MSQSGKLGGVTFVDGAIGVSGTPQPMTGGASISEMLLMGGATHATNYTLTATDGPYHGSTAAATLQLRASPSTGEVRHLRNESATLYCSVDPNGKNLDGATTFFVLLPGEFQIIRYDGTAWYTIGGVGRKSVRSLTNFAAVNVVSTAAETEILGFTIPANFLGANGQLRFGWYGSYFNNSGGTRSFQIKCKVGGTTFIDGTENIGATGTTWGTRYDFTIKNAGATNVNYMAGGGIGLVDFVAMTTGVGATGLLGGASVRLGELQSNTDMAKDSTADLAVSFTVTPSFSSSSLYYKHWGGTVLYLPG